MAALPVSKEIKELDLVTLLALAETMAKNMDDGHLTLMRFTTCWKFFVGTPDLRTGEDNDRLFERQGYPSAQEAVAAMLLGEVPADL